MGLGVYLGVCLLELGVDQIGESLLELLQVCCIIESVIVEEVVWCVIFDLIVCFDCNLVEMGVVVYDMFVVICIDGEFYIMLVLGIGNVVLGSLIENIYVCCLLLLFV